MHLAKLLVLEVPLDRPTCLLKSHLVSTGVRGYNLPAVVKLFEIYRGGPHHLLVGTREIDGPPS
jgi:hypothetical protein